jgi:hypothetical protein
MTTVKMTPQQITENPAISQEVHKSGSKVVLIATIDADEFDALVAAGAEFEDYEDDGHTEAIMTTDGWTS